MSQFSKIKLNLSQMQYVIWFISKRDLHLNLLYTKEVYKLVQEHSAEFVYLSGAC